MEEEEDMGFRLTLFSDIKQNFKDIRENVSYKISEALENDLMTEINEVSRNSNSIVDSIDADDVPLAKRIQQTSKDNDDVIFSPRRTRSCRGRNAKKVAELEDCSMQAAITEVVVCSDTESEVEYIGQGLNDSFNVDTSVCMDSSIDEIFEEDENKLISVKVNWMDLKVHRFEVRKHQKFTAVFDELAEKENVPREKILLILRDKIFIKRDDTPDNLKLSIVDIIEGGVTKEVYKTSGREDAQETSKDMLEFKCVLKDKKKPLSIYIKKTQTMHHLMVKAAEQLECTLEKLKFMFEGDQLDSDATPIDLDLEGGEIIDVLFKQ